MPRARINGIDDDIAMPPAMADTLDRYLPHSEIVVIRNAGHLSNLEQSGAFNAALDRFLRNY